MVQFRKWRRGTTISVERLPRVNSAQDSRFGLENARYRQVKQKRFHKLARIGISPAQNRHMLILRIFLKRLAYALALVFAVVVLNFGLIHLAPGDPVDTIAGTMGGLTPELRTHLRAEFGLDQSIWVQLGIYLTRLLHGNLGYSYFFNLPVSQLILDRVPATLSLVFSAIIAAFLLGTFLGVLASRKPGGLLSQSITVLALIGYSAPVFWTGIMLILVLASAIPIFPVSGMRSIGASDAGLSGILDVAFHLVLPCMTLALVYLALYSRLTRASMLDVLGSDYIRTARAKGVSERSVYFKHALRNALLPLITVLGVQFGNAFAGAILVETVFNWPGLGRLAFDSVLRRDYPTILGVLLISSVIVVVINQLTEFCYRLADPRIER